jgi:hypothetical protein
MSQLDNLSLINIKTLEAIDSGYFLMRSNARLILLLSLVLPLRLGSPALPTKFWNWRLQQVTKIPQPVPRPQQDRYHNSPEMPKLCQEGAVSFSSHDPLTAAYVLPRPLRIHERTPSFWQAAKRSGPQNEQ